MTASLHIGYELGKDVVSEFEPHKFTAMASDLGLRAGQWPEVITTELGNKQPFLYDYHYTEEGDLQFVVYRQGNGCISLKVFND